MDTKTMWVALALVAVAWTPTASAGNCTNYGIHQEVNVGDKDCSYEEGNYYQTCHASSGAGAGAGAAAVGPGSGDPEASAGATAGGNCTQTQNADQNQAGGSERDPDGQLPDGLDMLAEAVVSGDHVWRTVQEA